MAHLKYKWREVRPHLVSGLLYGLVRFIGSTMRMTVVGERPSYEKTIICGWHGRTFAFANHFRNKGFWVIISQSRDGEMQSRIFGRLGFQIIRGSTGRGGERALVQSIRALKNGGTMAMTPDGPRGPNGVVQHGVMVMAQKSGAALLPGAFSCKPRKVFKSWDKYTVPWPFARGVILFSDPIFVPPDADALEVERLRLKLEQEMHQLEEKAERMMGHHSPVRSVQAEGQV
jgi:lysophospholipid acyltransferase (LPLAT)-like uncharacterized protein